MPGHPQCCDVQLFNFVMVEMGRDELAWGDLGPWIHPISLVWYVTAGKFSRKGGIVDLIENHH